VWCQSKKGSEEIRSFELSGKKHFFNYDETKSKEEKNKKNESKKKAHRAKRVQALLTAARTSGGKDERQVTGIEQKYWMGTEISRLGGYGFRSTVTAGDRSDQKGGEMGAGYMNLRKQRRKVGREEEGSSANRPELAAFVLALRDTPVTKPMLYLCDNQALLESCEKIGQ